VSAGCILVTGATGYLGGRVARWVLEHTDASLLLGRRDPAAAAPGSDRVVVVPLDVTRDDDFARLHPSEITAIVHTAAVTRFNVDRETAERVNIEGTERVLRLAERCPHLTSFTLLGSLYAAGLRGGRIVEAPLPERDGFANHYEWSKWGAERRLVDGHPDLPWRIVRVATVIADDVTGRVVQQNAFHNTLRLFFYGLLGMIPGDPRVPLYFVTGEQAASAIGTLAFDPSAGGVYHVSPTAAESVTIEGMIDAALSAFGEDESFRRRRVVRPLVVDRESFDLLARGVSGFTGAVLHEAVASVAPFAPQLYVRKEIVNERLREALPALRFPEPRALVRDTCATLARSRWGRNEEGAGR
jgi:nucleoside-diphosphate-sugar epimerase